MNRKTLWIVFWMTIVYWLGGAFGCAGPGEEQNYKVLEEDQPKFQTEPDPASSSHQAAPPAAQAAAEHQPDSTVPTAPPGRTDYPSEPTPPSVGLPPALTPSVIPLDRSYWRRQVVGPADGITHHNPIYFSDLPLDPEHLPADQQAELETRLRSVLEGAKAGNWNPTNAAGLVLQPGKFVWDVGAGAISQPIKPFFADDHTP